MSRRWIVVVLVAAALAGCLGGQTTSDDVTGAVDDATNGTDAPDLPATIAGIEHRLQVPDVPTGAGLTIHGDHAYVSGLGSGFRILNVTDPTEPSVTGSVDLYSRDAAILEYGDHRHAAILAAQGDGMHIVDVTDPADPIHLNTTHPDGAVSHNAAVLHGTSLVYNSEGSGRGGEVQILNLSDPEHPKLVTTFGRSGCHDIEFWHGDDASRLICAGEAATELYDITDDPTDPEYITEVRNPFVSVVGFAGGDGGALTPGLHHWSLLSEDGETLIIGDEFAGGLGPGCYLYDDTTGEAVASPIGAIWFYDVSDETDPQLEGWFSPPPPAESTAQNQNPSCTAHFGEIIPGRDKLAVGWYAAGTIVVDYADPSNPTMVDQWNGGTDTWDVRRKGKHLITGDVIRGSDVIELTAG